MVRDKEPPTPEDGPETSHGNDRGDAYFKKARTLVWLVAGGFMLVGVMDVGLYWFKCQHDQTTPNAWRCVYLSIPLVIGLVILLKTSALARRIEDWLEE
jgi:hypothetical protein